MSKKVALNGVQKVAIMMMSLAQEDSQAASSVMAHFTEDEAQQITAEIMRMRRADPETVDSVMDEMAEIIDSGRVALRGGDLLARSLLANAFGDDRVGEVMERAEGVLAGRAFEFMDELDPNQIRAMISDETPQIMAVVLSNLNPKVSAEVMSGLEDSVRDNVALRIAKMGTLNPDAVQIAADLIKSRVIHVASPRKQAKVGGVQSLVDIVNRADSNTERGVLEYMDVTDPELGAEVRSKMFTFGDLLRLDARTLQLVLRSVKIPVLARALRGANPALDEMIRNNLSTRNVEALDEEISSEPRLKSSDVEEARGEIVRQVRALEEAGELDLSSGQDEEYV